MSIAKFPQIVLAYVISSTILEGNMNEAVQKVCRHMPLSDLLQFLVLDEHIHNI